VAAFSAEFVLRVDEPPAADCAELLLFQALGLGHHLRLRLELFRLAVSYIYQLSLGDFEMEMPGLNDVLGDRIEVVVPLVGAVFVAWQGFRHLRGDYGPCLQFISC